MANSAPDTEYELFVGQDAEMAYLLTVWADGTRQLATRPVDGGTRARWSAPITLAPEPT